MYVLEQVSVCDRCGGRLFGASSRFCTKCGFSLVGIKLEAHELQKSVRDRATHQRKYLLRDISLVINPGEFVGVIGASGSGKSTLVDALSGRRPVKGAVLYNGMDLYRSSGSLKSAIGYVPQQDIVHRKITVERALTYTALLRLPVTTSLSAINERIKLVLRRVELTDKLRQSIDTPVPLSGGQLKRVNLATELMSEPKVLFLDEPCSGLDPGIEEGLMRLFALLARDGRTVICVTHTLNEIETCGLIAVLHAGVLVFFGPPRELCQYFKLQRATDVYKTLASYTPAALAERYRRSDLYDEFVARRLQGSSAQAAPDLPKNQVPETSSDRRLLDWRQAMILTRRYIDLMVADKRTLALLLLQAPIIGLIMGFVFNSSGSLAERFRIDRQVMFTMVMSAIWLGCLNSSREVVKELPIYVRERAVNLEVGSYLTSKLLPLSGLCAVQCITLLAIVSYKVPISGSIVERGAVLFFTALAATSMGLMVSALVSSADKAIAAIPLLLIPQMILSDVSIKLEHVSRIVAEASIIAFWSFSAIKQTLPEDVRSYDWSSGSFSHGVGMLTLFFLVFLGGAALGLKLKDRQAFRPPPNPIMQGLKLALLASVTVFAVLVAYHGSGEHKLVEAVTNLVRPVSALVERPPAPEATPVAGAAPDLGTRPDAATGTGPAIASISPIRPEASQRIVISGHGFGSLPPFNGDSPYLRITDLSRNWNAGWIGNAVTLDVIEWSDSQIVLDGFTGRYGMLTWSLGPGDRVVITVRNPQTGGVPAVFNTMVSQGEGPTAQSPAEAVAGKTCQRDIAGAQPWTATAVFLNPGENVDISATGIVCFGALAGCHSPSGQPRPAPFRALGGRYIAPGLPIWSLIARVGPNGTPFEIGPEKHFQADSAGELFLGVNDNWFPDNRGTWSVSITLPDGGT